MTAGPKPIRMLGDTVVYLLVAQIVLAFAQMIALLHRIDVLQSVGSLGTLDMEHANNIVAVISALDFLVFVGTVVFWCIWQHHAQYNAILLTTGGLEFTPGWAVGWWFIPVANLWKPWQAVRELWKASHGGDAWRRLATWPVLGWWWAIWLASLVHIYVGGASFGTMSAPSPPSVSDAMFNDRWQILSLGLRIVAAFLAIKIVQAVLHLQEHAPPRVSVEGMGLPDPPAARPDSA